MKKNMKLKLALIITLLLFLNYIFGQEKLDKNKYFNEEIGWTITIPEGWKVRDKQKQKSVHKKGQKAIEDATGEKMDISSLKHLLYFEKDKFNIFVSSSEECDFTYQEWLENEKLLKETINNTYKNLGIDFVITKSRETKIDGLKFNAFSVTLFGPNKKIIMTQVIFNRLIENYCFSMTINYNSEVNKKDLLKALMSSKFSKKAP